MRFREEVFARICTIVTVVVLLGIVIFEAVKLQGMRNEYEQAHTTAASLQESLQKMVDANAVLQQKNGELEAFQEKWASYASFADSKEVLTLRSDLLSRPQLIPDQAKLALDRWLDGREGTPAGENGDSGKEEEKGSDRDKQTEEELAEEVPSRRFLFAFRDPEGESVFVPASIGVGDEAACMIYTAAFEKNYEAVVELIFTVDFTVQHSVFERDSEGRIAWKCVAYNVGDGWQGVAPTEPLEEEDAE